MACRKGEASRMSFSILALWIVGCRRESREGQNAPMVVILGAAEQAFIQKWVLNRVKLFSSGLFQLSARAQLSLV